MNRLLVFLVILGLVVASSLAVAQRAETFFPTITTQDLNGRTATFPKQFPGERTVVLIAFQREQQRELDTWIEKLGLKEPNSPEWIEMPVVADYGSIWRAFVDNGMRSGIVTFEARSRVFTVYGSSADFRAKLNLPSDDQVYVLVVRKDGAVVARADGQYSDAKVGPVRSALSR